ARVDRVASLAPNPHRSLQAGRLLRDHRHRARVEPDPRAHDRPLANRRHIALGHGAITYLIPVPLRTPAIASCTRSSGMRWVIRSRTGTSPEAIRRNAAALCAGVDPAAPTSDSSP